MAKLVDDQISTRADRSGSPVPGVPASGKSREISNLAFLNATNWLFNGHLTAGNSFIWDIDNNVGLLTSNNAYRYSRNVLFGLNVQWFIGRSGRYTDPYVLSREQRFNDIEFTLTYEI
jgi:hypothetical protein